MDEHIVQLYNNSERIIIGRVSDNNIPVSILSPQKFNSIYISIISCVEIEGLGLDRIHHYSLSTNIQHDVNLNPNCSNIDPDSLSMINCITYSVIA